MILKRLRTNGVRACQLEPGGFVGRLSFVELFKIMTSRLRSVRLVALAIIASALGAAVYGLQTVPLVVWRLDTDVWKIEAASTPDLPNDRDRESMVSVNGTVVTLVLGQDGVQLRGFQNSKEVWVRQIPSTATQAEKSDCEAVFGVLRSTDADGILVQARLCDKTVRTFGVSATTGKTLWSRSDVGHYATIPARRIAPFPGGYVVALSDGLKTRFAVLDADSGKVTRSAEFVVRGSFWDVRSDGRYAIANFRDKGDAVLVDFSQAKPIAKTIAVEAGSMVDVFGETAFFVKDFEDRYEIWAVQLSTQTLLWRRPVYKLADRSRPENITATSFGPMVVLSSGEIHVHNLRSGLLKSGVKPRDSATSDSLTLPFTTKAGGVISDTFVSREFSAALGRELVHDTSLDSVIYVEKDVPRWRLFAKRPPNKIRNAGNR
jgi:hypothetical protein